MIFTQPFTKGFEFPGDTKYRKFPQNWDFQAILINKKRHFFDIWHKIGELYWPHHEGYGHKYHLPEKNWFQLMWNYSLVMYFAFKVDNFFVLV